MPIDSTIEISGKLEGEVLATPISPETGEYALAIKLPYPVSEEAAEMNKILAENIGLPNSPNIWHVTLFHGAYKIEELPDILKAIAELDVTKFSINLTHGYVTANRWVDWKVQDTDFIHSIHRQVVEKLSPFTEGRKLARSADPLVYDDPLLPPEKKAQIDKYGVTGIDSDEGSFYNPHVTLFYQYPPDERLKDAHLHLGLGDTNQKVDISELIFGKLDFNGNIIEEIATFPLADPHHETDTPLTGAAAGFHTDC